MYLRWETDERRYEAMLERDLFGDEVLVVVWGGKRNRIGQRRCVAIGNEIAPTLLQIAALRSRHGYALTELRR